MKPMAKPGEDNGEQDWLAGRFEEHRAHLWAVAYRMLGSPGEAEDAVQESWLRLSRAGASGVENLGGWLTTVVARVCLDMLRSRAVRSEEPLGEETPELVVSDENDPEREALLADSVGLALLVVLDTLNPAERLAFVLHDLFDVPFEEIAPIVGRSPTAARQLASRARRRVQGKGEEQEAEAASDADLSRQREIVGAFLAASRNGDFDALLEALDPDVTVRADAGTVAMGASAGIESEADGAQAVARQFAGRAQGARLAIIDGTVGAVWAPGGQPRVVFRFTISDGKIAAIETIADPERLAQLNVTILYE
jgi:RNA polymerase sigma-70 factor (ECF subfamily)